MIELPESGGVNDNASITKDNRILLVSNAHMGIEVLQIFSTS
jgi:hypothetical protein